MSVEDIAFDRVNVNLLPYIENLNKAWNDIQLLMKHFKLSALNKQNNSVLFENDLKLKLIYYFGKINPDDIQKLLDKATEETAFKKEVSQC